MDYIENGERGQYMIIGAAIIAVSLVALTLFINIGIYSQNLASRETGTTLDPQDTVVETKDLSREVMEEVNKNTGTVSEYNDSFSSGAKILQKNLHQGGATTSIELASVTSGLEITQESKGQFTSSLGFEDWTVIFLASKSRQFELTFDEETLSSSKSSSFSISVPTAQIQIYNPTSDEVRVEVSNISEPGSCTVRDDYGKDPDTVNVDLTDGKVDGTDCPALRRVFERSPYSVTFLNGDEIEGTWRVILPDSASVATTSGSPRKYSDRVYSSVVTVRHSTRRGTFVEDVYVAEGEHP